MEALQGACLLAATLSVGLMAGVFGLYARTIMPGLGQTDDRPSPVRSRQSIGRSSTSWKSHQPWMQCDEQGDSGSRDHTAGRVDGGGAQAEPGRARKSHASTASCLPLT
jgi:hypothetical protein